MKPHLENARIAIAAEDWKTALDHLLCAWRVRRVARLAELIDRVSEHIPGRPIAGMTVKARTAASLEMAQKLDPADLGSLLATEWPGKWQDALAVLEALGQFPDDPRIALALTRLVIETPFDSATSLAFYRPALRIIAQAGDHRTKPLFEADLARPKPRQWNTRMRPLLEAAIASPAVVHELALGEEAAIAAVEALFASDMRAEATNEKSDADFLAAIYADPTDDTARAVYGDWLTERGDPRGEFITLQLTPNPSDKAKKREAALLKKHGAEWAGPLHRVFEEDRRTFTRGFLSRGIVFDAPKTEITKNLAHPEWVAVESLGFVRFQEATVPVLLAVPWLRHLRSLIGVPEALIARIAAESLAPQLEEVRMLLVREEVLTRDVLEGRRRIARGFPQLKCFGIGVSTGDAPDDLAKYLAGPLPEGLERIIVVGWKFPLAAVATAVAKLDVAIVEARDAFAADDGRWRFELRRDDTGRFTRLRGGPGNTALPTPGHPELMMVLASLPELTELVIEPGGGTTWNRHQLFTIEAALAKAAALRTIDVPWDRDVGGSVADAPRLSVGFRFRDGIEPNLDAIWQAVTSAPISLSFDSTTINYGAHEALDADGLAHVKKVFAKKRSSSMIVYRKRSAETAQVVFGRTHFELTMPRPEGFDLDAWLAWLVAFLDRMPVDDFWAPFLRRDEQGMLREAVGRALGPIQTPHRWLMGFGLHHAADFDLDELAETVRALDHVRVLRTKLHVLLLTSDSPEHIPSDEQRDALEAKLKEAFWTRYERMHGYTPQKVGAKLLGPALEQRGFTRATSTTWTRRGATFLMAQETIRHSDGVCLMGRLYRADGAWKHETITSTIRTPEEATSSLELIISMLDQILHWLETPEPEGYTFFRNEDTRLR